MDANVQSVGYSSIDQKSLPKDLSGTNLTRTLDYTHSEVLLVSHGQTAGSEQPHAQARIEMADNCAGCHPPFNTNLKPQHGSHQTAVSSKSNTTRSNNGSQTNSQRSKNDEPVLIEKVRSGEELRTYLCVKNVPTNLTQKDYQAELQKRYQSWFQVS